MLKTYQYRAYPSKTTERVLVSWFGAKRWVWNKSKEIHDVRYEYYKASTSYTYLSSLLPFWKREPDLVWLREVDSTVLQQTLRDLDKAYKQFYRRVRQGKTPGYPRFKSRYDTVQSIRSTNFKIEKLNHKWMLLKLAHGVNVKFRVSRELPSTPKMVTIKHNQSLNEWTVSFVCEVEPTPAPKSSSRVGIDMGVETLATTVNSEGEVTKLDNPKFLKQSQLKLARQQKVLSRKQQPEYRKGLKASNRWKKQGKLVARTQAKIRRQRLDYHHKATTLLVHENQGISVENLNVSSMSRALHRGFRRNMNDTSIGLFLTLLRQKANEYERELVVVDQWFPSSQICSMCGMNSGRKPLNIREWTCTNCGIAHDRDINAATNILNEAGRASRGENVKLTLDLSNHVVLNEAQTPRLAEAS